MDRGVLLKALQTVARAVPSRTTKDILKNVRMEATSSRQVLLTATDAEIGLLAELEDVDVDKAGVCLLPASRMISILREVTAQRVTLDVDKQRVWIRAGLSEFAVQTEDPADFPPVATFTDEGYYRVASGDLRRLIARTAFACDDESTRYALGAIETSFSGDRMTMAATDSRRLAVAHGKCETVGAPRGNCRAQIAHKAITLLASMLEDAGDIQIAVHINDVAIRCGGFVLTSQLVQGRFPDWTKVVPTRWAFSSDIVVGPLLSAIRQVMIVRNEDSRGVGFSFSKGTLRLTGQAADIGQSRIDLPIAYDGEPIAAMFDPAYFADALKGLEPSASIEFKLISKEDPAGLMMEDYTYIVMPLAK